MRVGAAACWPLDELLGATMNSGRAPDLVDSVAALLPGAVPPAAVLPRAVLLVLPAVIPTAAVLAVGLGSGVAQSLGLLPLVGKPRASVDAYTEVLNSGDLGPSVLVTLGVAGVSSLLAVVVGTAVALAVHRRRPAGRLLGALATATVPVPHLIGAVAFGLLLSDSGLVARALGAPSGGFPQLVAGPWWIAVILEYAWKESAFVALVVLAALRTRAVQYEATAAVLGAAPWQRFRAVTLPLIAPAVLATGTIAFSYCVGSYEVAWLLGSSYPQPLAVNAYQQFTTTDLLARPQALALAMIAATLALGVVIVGVASLRRTAVWR